VSEQASISEAVNALFSKDNNLAYEALKQLLTESEKTNGVYEHFDTFTQMKEDDNSYFRTRGLLLISTNARWDAENKLDTVIDRCLLHILDEKPITSRQFIKTLPEMAKYKPALTAVIKTTLQNADTGIYPDTMRPLVSKDIADALKKIDRLPV